MEEREVFVETGGLYGPWPSPKKHNVFCIRKNKKKLIYNQTPKTWEFYDLESDPKELNNIYAKESELTKFYKERLFHYLKENLIYNRIDAYCKCSKNIESLFVRITKRISSRKLDTLDSQEVPSFLRTLLGNLNPIASGSRRAFSTPSKKELPWNLQESSCACPK